MNENEKYLNVTLTNAREEHEDEQISISIVGILRNLRRFFALWLAITIIASVLALVGTALVKRDSYKKTVSLVSFTFDGIENGLDPKGNTFDINTLKSPQIIESALDELGIPFEIDAGLVRGLDYYSHTVFELEVNIPEFGAQNVIGAGGRYDDLISDLGYKPVLDHTVNANNTTYTINHNEPYLYILELK